MLRRGVVGLLLLAGLLLGACATRPLLLACYPRMPATVNSQAAMLCLQVDPDDEIVIFGGPPTAPIPMPEPQDENDAS